MRSTGDLKLRLGGREKCEKSFSYHTGNLNNRLAEVVDFDQIEKLRGKLLCYFWSYFNIRTYYSRNLGIFSSYLINILREKS